MLYQFKSATIRVLHGRLAKLVLIVHGHLETCSPMNSEWNFSKSYLKEGPETSDMSLIDPTQSNNLPRVVEALWARTLMIGNDVVGNGAISMRTIPISHCRTVERKGMSDLLSIL